MSPTALNIAPWATFWSMGKGKGTPMGYISARAMHEAGLDVVYISPRRGKLKMHVPFERFRHLTFRCPNLPGFESTKPRRFLRRLRLFSLRVMRYIYFAAKAYRVGRAEGLRHPPALVCAHGTISALPAYLLARRFRVPSMLRLYGVTLHPILNSKIKLCYTFEETICFRYPFARVLIADDGSCGDIVATRLGVDAKRVLLIRDGLDKEILTQAEADRDSLRRELGFPPDVKVVLSVSRLGFPRNVDLIIKAMKLVLDRCPDHILVILGDGRQREGLEHLTRLLHIEEKVVFKGAVPREQVYKHMLAAHVYVTASHISNLCNSTLEAMALGSSIVATDTACTRSVFKDGENGVIVPFGDEKALAEGILRVTGDPEFADKISKGALDYARRHFYSHEKRIDIEKDIIRELVN